MEFFRRLEWCSIREDRLGLSFDGGSGDEVDVDATEIGLNVHLARRSGIGLSLLVDDDGGLLDVGYRRFGVGRLERTLLLL